MNFWNIGLKYSCSQKLCILVLSPPRFSCSPSSLTDGIVQEADIILVSAGTKLIFFIVSAMMLHISFRRKTMVIRHQCCCWAVLCRFKAVSASRVVLLVTGLGEMCTRSREETEPGQLTKLVLCTIWQHVEQWNRGWVELAEGRCHCLETGWSLISRQWAIAVYLLFCKHVYYIYIIVIAIISLFLFFVLENSF